MTLRLLPFIHNLRLHIISIKSFDEQGHTAVIAFYDHSWGDSRIPRKVYDILAFRANTEHIRFFHIILDHFGEINF